MLSEEDIYLQIHESYHPVVKVYMKKIKKALQQTGTIYPNNSDIFRVFQTPLDDINVVILGQDPYHGFGQATGLAFDCSRQSKQQPSLKNIFKEINNEFPQRNYNLQGNNLEKWTSQGIFLLNSALTVKEGEPGSLMNFWYDFTDAVIQYISDYNSTCIFLLMGNPAKAKSIFISDKTRIITCTHPSPLSASRGFFGSGVFLKIEQKLNKQINWSN